MKYKKILPGFGSSKKEKFFMGKFDDLIQNGWGTVFRQKDNGLVS